MIYLFKLCFWVAGMAQWWEHSPSTNVAGFDSQTRRHMSVDLLLVLSLLRGFFSRFFSFPPSTKTNISKFQFDLDRGPALADVPYIIIYFK